MPATTSPVATTNSSSSSSSPAQMPLSVHRPALFSRKRKLSAVEATSPTSLDEVSNSRSSSSNNNGSTPHEGRVISPKKKAKAEERASEGNLSKWESQVVVSIAGALDLDCLNGPEPISFCAAPAGDLTADELVILCRFLA